MLIKHEITTGFKCNDDSWCVMTKDYGELFTHKIEVFNKAINDGYVEIEHDDYLEDV